MTNAVACGASSVGIGSTGVLGCSGTVRAGGGDISGFGSGGSDVPSGDNPSGAGGFVTGGYCGMVLATSRMSSGIYSNYFVYTYKQGIMPASLLRIVEIQTMRQVAAYHYVA
ncbi:MAG: hypothetical protein AAB542_00495 [Patescibacteria group bacterium]